MNQTAEFVIRHGYAVLFFWILAEQGALPIPSLPLLLVCGAMARVGDLNSGAILFYGLTACLIADSFWFLVGRSKGTKILGLLCRMTLEPDSCVRQTENGFSKYGVGFLLVAKFVPGMNALAAPLAGSASVSWGEFLLFDALGASLWISSFGTLGYLFSGQLEAIGDVVGRAGFRLFLSIIVAIAAWIGWKYFQRRRFLKKLDMARITADELRRMLDAGEEVFVIDVRSEAAVERRRIPGSVNIPLSTLAQRYKEVPKDREIILFCTCPNEVTAAKAALTLRKYGITRVRPLEGGADAWLEVQSVPG
jgi:membrane protein DedA with SNARE-associated domain/rhodanese-related sulfurtransferase